MKPFYWVLLIVAQIWFAADVSLKPFNAAKVSYPHEELVAALKAQDEHPSPATSAAVRDELDRAGHYIVRRQLTQCGVLIVVFLAIDVAFFCGWKNLRYKSTSA